MTTLKTKTDASSKPDCPYCNKVSEVVKIGHMNTKTEILQRYKCKVCSKTFSDRPLKYVTYPPKIIFTAISTYNQGNTKRDVASILSKKHRIKVPIPTIHSWLKRYQGICTLANLRQNYKIDPQTIIKSKKLHHNQIYNLKYHELKLKFAARKFPRLGNYIEFIFNNCPNDLFKAEGPRCSNLKIDIKPKRVTKYNNAPKLAEFALTLAKTNKERHEKVLNFMLTNDSATIAIEVPVFLDPSELTRKKQKIFGMELKDSLTGHLDILQVRFNHIYVLDYKPEAKKGDRGAAEQVFLYALALSKRTNIPLENFTCAYFDDRNYYQFKPMTD
jgi:transposase-like protein